MILDEKLRATELYAIYGELLTKKQITVFELYYFEDYSINEISDMLTISKNAVYASIINSQKKLERFENFLQIKEKYEKNIETLNKHKVSQVVIDELL